MLATVSSSAVIGLEALPIRVEVRLQKGKNLMTIIGLADSAIQESRGRILSCLNHSGFDCSGDVLVNLAPAEVRKEGSSFDLPIAIAILVASRQLRSTRIADTRFVGELSLDGKVRPVKGVIAHVIEAVESGASAIIVPKSCVPEASLIDGIRIFGVETLTDAISVLQGDAAPVLSNPSTQRRSTATHSGTLSEVFGQEMAKRALVVAAAGGHNILMIGPPGCGKSMLAKRFPSLLPPLTKQDALEVARIHSIAGLEIADTISGIRPFRAPHHVVTQAGLIGGGSTIIRPGEVSLAHQGVLFLDEFPEFKRSVLEAMRAPLEDGRVRVSRARGSYVFPARFQLIAAMNPCPCGSLGANTNQCKCSRGRIRGYLQKLSQPILDRIDIHIEMHAIRFSEMQSASREDSTIGENDIIRSHEMQIERGQRNAGASFELLSGKDLLTSGAMRLLERSADKLHFSARSVVRVLRVARTIADLDRSQIAQEEHVAEALGYRSLERIAAYANGI